MLYLLLWSNNLLLLQYGENNVFLAQTLVNYKPEYENVMAWVFGHTFICSNIDIAEDLCYKYMKRTITVDGSVFDPDGVIQGGKSNFI